MYMIYLYAHTYMYMHMLYLLGCFGLQVQNNNLQMYDLLIKKSGDNKRLSQGSNCYLLTSNTNLKHNMVKIELLTSNPPKFISPLLNTWFLKPRSSIKSLSTSAFYSLFTSNPSSSTIWLPLNLEIALPWREWRKSSGLLNCTALSMCPQDHAIL